MRRNHSKDDEAPEQDAGRQSTPRRPDHELDMAGLRRKLRRQYPRRMRSAVGQPAARRDKPVTRKPVAEAYRPPVGDPVRLEDVVEGTEVSVSGRGMAYLVSSALTQLGQEYEGLARAFETEMAGAQSRLSSFFDADGGAASPRLDQVLFMDLETTGLSSTPLFLIGIMVWENSELVLTQYLARNYAEERAVISLFAQDLAARPALITFNGKSFDLPYVQMRAAATGVQLPAESAHCDLLIEARRAWSDTVPNCQLVTLEEYVCGRPRHDDISGAHIPDAYHEFVRSENAADIAAIMEHNRLDLITLAELMVKLPATARATAKGNGIRQRER